MSPSTSQALPKSGAYQSLPAEERILLATIHALAEMNPAALTIQQICREANVSAPTLYYHFGNKDGVIAAAIERLVYDWLEVIDQQEIGRAHV